MKYIVLIIYHLFGLVFPALCSYVLNTLQELHTIYYGIYTTIFYITGILVLVLFGCYVAIHRFVRIQEKPCVRGLMCLIYLSLAILAYFVSLISFQNRWILWLCEMDNFHIWGILFGYFFIQVLADIIDYTKRRRNRRNTEVA